MIEIASTNGGIPPTPERGAAFTTWADGVSVRVYDLDRQVWRRHHIPWDDWDTIVDHIERERENYAATGSVVGAPPEQPT